MIDKGRVGLKKEEWDCIWIVGYIVLIVGLAEGPAVQHYISTNERRNELNTPDNKPIVVCYHPSSIKKQTVLNE